jgi:hypothetical protein
LHVDSLKAFPPQRKRPTKPKPLLVEESRNGSISIFFLSFKQKLPSRRFLFQLIRKKTGKIFKREEEVGLAVLIEVYT